jgi:hypothetical protein
MYNQSENVNTSNTINPKTTADDVGAQKSSLIDSIVTSAVHLEDTKGPATLASTVGFFIF